MLKSNVILLHLIFLFIYQILHCLHFSAITHLTLHFRCTAPYNSSRLDKPRTLDFTFGLVVLFLSAPNLLAKKQGSMKTAHSPTINNKSNLIDTEYHLLTDHV